MKDTTTYVPVMPQETLIDGGIAQDVYLTFLLLLGFSVKILSSIWRESKRNEGQSFSLWEFLVKGPRKYRILGALELTVVMVFVVSDEIFTALMDYRARGHRVGNIAIFFLGFLADEVFVLLHLFNDKVMGYVADKLGIDQTSNGPAKKPRATKDKERNLPNDL